MVWGNRNFTPFVTDALREAHERRPAPAASPWSRAPTPPTPRAASTARTSPARRRAVAERGARAGRSTRSGPTVNHPGLRAGQQPPGHRGRRAGSARTRTRRSRLLFVTHSIPTAMDDTSGPGDGEGNAYRRQHLALGAAITDEVNATLEPRPRRRAGVLLALRVRRASPGSSRTSTTGSRSWPPRAPWRGGGADRVRLRPHGGRSTTSTPRRPRRPSGSGCGWCGCRRWASTTSSSRGLVDLALERAAEARGEAPTPVWPGATRGPPCAGPAAAPTCVRPSRPCAGRTEMDRVTASRTDELDRARAAGHRAGARGGAAHRRRAAGDLGVARPRAAPPTS